jgi:hypothetical protein
MEHDKRRRSQEMGRMTRLEIREDAWGKIRESHDLYSPTLAGHY